MLARVILHVDMDAFYAAVEIRDDPSLAGKPLIIGHRGPRGVVSTCSYEARKFGVRSAMPSVVAARRCPDAIWLRGRMPYYLEVSRAIRRLFDDFSPLVEPLSIDEAFIDLGGIATDLHAGSRIAESLRRRVREAHGLSASVGVAPNKFLAKIASDLDKPDGLTVLSLDDVRRKLWPLPVERLWGVGPRTAERLRQGGIGKIGELLDVSRETLAARIGDRLCVHLQRLARGEDDRPVSNRHRAGSISEERTYGVDLVDPLQIDRAILARAEGLARRLRRAGLTGRTVRLKVRSGDFTTWTRSVTLAGPTDLTEPLLAAGRALFRERIRLTGRGVRLLGLGVSGLAPAGAGQATLFEAPDERRARRMARAADAVRDRMGEGSLTRARLIRHGPDRDEPDESSSLPSVD